MTKVLSGHADSTQTVTASVLFTNAWVDAADKIVGATMYIDR